MSRRAVAIVVLLLAVSLSAAAEPVKFSGSVRLRAEHWGWFETPGYDDSYLFFGSLIRASASQQRDRFDWQAEVAQPALLSLPDRAVAPGAQGQLGLGATYYAANGSDENAATVFIKQAAVRFKWPGHALRVGRFEFTDGAEAAPKNPALAAVKAGRVANRLVGTFGFSHVGRSFDGVQYVHTRPGLNFNVLAVKPTVGAFDVSGMDEIEDVTLLYGSVTHSAAQSDARLFVIGYNDERAAVKTDSRPQAVRAADRQEVEVFTVGGHYLAAAGPINLLGWVALQTGEWGALDHSANALALEAGHNAGGSLSTAVRGGIFRSSGDDDPADGDHGTFFQILPTPRVYARFPFYNAMNSTDLFVGLSMKPAPKLSLTSEIHRLSLTESSDLWYSGGGAFQDQTFGFAGRPSGGNSGLALVADLNVDYAFTSKTTFTLYLAAANGDDVIDAIYAGKSGTMAYFEVLRRF
ncbi:MAG: alginate export family protein [Thermoanaerobaculia bacterium]